MQRFLSFLLYVVALELIFGQASAARGGAGAAGRRPRRNNTAIQEDRALGSFLQRVSVGRIVSCQLDSDCPKRGNNKCLSDNLYLCGRQSVANIFQAADDKDCTIDTDCQSLTGSNRLASRCTNGKCDLCGPRVCQTDTDCCQSQQGGQKCVKLSGYLDTRCWKSCSKKEDCLVNGSGKGKLLCMDGICQKKNRKTPKVA